MSTDRRRAGVRRGALAGLVMLAGALAACGVGPATDKDKIAKATSTYLRALADGDRTTACTLLSPHARGDRCPQALADRPLSPTRGMLKRAADASLDIRVHASTATASLGEPHGARLTLVKLGANWRIDSGYTVPPPAGPGRVAPVIAGGGRLVEVGGGRSLYLKCVGSGTPTVVLEAGFPGTSDVWRDVQPALGHVTRTCAYDRTGLGNSPPTAGVRDAGNEIDDLQRLLHGAHLSAPYVLVGHSYGGMLVRLFAHHHPRETAGVVLVDARGNHATRRQLAIWPTAVAPAVRRAVFAPVQHRVNLAASERLVSRVRTLGDTPLAVVTAGRHGEWARVVTPDVSRALDRLWATMQDELAALSSDHIHVIALRSDHFIQRRDGQPGVVIGAVRTVVQAARSHTNLPSCRRLFNGPGVRCRD